MSHERASWWINCFGRKGQGKSYLAKQLIRHTKKPVVIWDPKREWGGSSAKDMTRPSGVVHNFRDFLTWCARPEVNRLPPCTAFQLPKSQFAAWATWVLHTGNVQCVVDELHGVAPSNACPPEFGELLTTSRHANVDLLLIGQRPTAVHPDARANADSIYAFQTSHAADLDFYSGICGKEWAQRLTTLEVGSPQCWVSGQ